MNIADIEKLAAWSEPKEVQTKYGPRMLRKAPVTPAFSEAYRAHKDEVKALGANFSKNRDGEWELAWWMQLSAEVKEARAVAVEESRAASADIDLPKPARLEYMPFQKAGIRYGLSHPNVLIGDEMGLGKTIQAIGMINADPNIDTALVICPKSLKLNWLRELNKWLTRNLSVGVVNSHWPDTNIVIMNYEALSKWNEFIHMRTWGAVIVDECHLIKNKKTLRSMNIKGYKPTPKELKDGVKAMEGIPTRRNIRMTGTPIVNRPVELWNIIEDLAPEQFGNFWSFAKRYCGATNTGWGWDMGGASNLDELQRRLRETVMVRRLKADVLTELPRKIRQVIELAAESNEQKAAVRRERSFSDESDDRMASLRAAVELSKAEGEDAYKQAVSRLQDASQVDFTEMSRLRHDTALSKVGAVIDYIKEALENGGKIVVFAHHRDVIDAIQEALNAK